MSDKDNFLTYLEWRGDLSFDKSPFNCVDALIFSQLIYLNFDNLLEQPFSSQISLYSLNRNFINAGNYSERCMMGAMINDGIPGLMDQCANSQRFGKVQVCGYVSILDRSTEIQFAAATFILPDKKHTRVIAYRGTDDSFLGWKEDFNLSYMDVIPSQKQALIYYKKARKALKGRFILAGHSKGGSDAIYSALNCTPSERNKITSIYNFDGPGFKQEVIDSKTFSLIKNRIFSFYPQFSIVGMIFKHDRRFEIIHSNGKSFMQHDPFSWAVTGNKFVNDIDFTDDSKFFAKSFNEWVTRLNSDEKKKFVDNLFDLCWASGKEKIADFEKEKIASTAKIFSAFSKLPSEDKKALKENMMVFFKVFMENMPLFSIFNPKNLKLRS